MTHRPPSVSLSMRRLRLLAPLLCLALATPLAAAVSPQPHHSGHWFSPDRSGEGWMLEMLSPEQALLYWFTYDEAGAQRWLTSAGQIDATGIDFDPVVLTTGGRFGPDFDPDSIVRQPVGRARLSFTDCATGSLSFDAFGQQMTLPWQRITSAMGLPCPGDTPPAPDGRAGQSGSWFDPARSGEGWSMQWLPDGRALMVWYSFDPAGAQHWMLDVGERDADGVLVFPQVHTTRGGRFGAAFDPDAVERIAWGELRFDFDCSGGRSSHTPVLDGFPAGSLSLAPLTRLAGTQCELPPRLDLDRATWSLAANPGPDRSEWPATVLDGQVYAAGGLSTLTTTHREFWRYHPGTDTWTRLADLPAPRDHAQMTAHEGAIWLFGGFSSGPQMLQVTSDAWRYDPATDRWSTLPPMPRARATGAAVSIGNRILLVGGIGPAENWLDRYDPATATWTSLAIDPGASRDHLGAVAIAGELWLVGGREPVSGITHNVVTIIDPGTGTSRPGPAMATARSGHAAAVLAGHIVVAGGESLFPPAMIGQAEYLDLATGAWRPLPPLPFAVHGAPAVALGDRLLVLPGSMAVGGISSSRRVQVLAVP
ncbi:MAG: hypothetical protein KF823_05475 [Xanthomonadales bacterium]|nr:hypothetical protein [Xanthomonadales bacterium]